MSMTDLPLVSMLRDRMQWHQARQKVLAENVANANTPGFQPKDLGRSIPSAAIPVSAGLPTQAGIPASAGPGAGVAMQRTDPLHLAAASGSDPAAGRAAKRYETTPSGNAVSLEDEMMKVADNQSEYQLAASLYGKSLALLRSAAGVRGA